MIEASARSAIVTGGARGIGLAIARRLVDDGYRVAALDVNDRALAALGDLDVPEDRLVAMRCSVTDEVEVQRTVAEVAQRFGRLDALVNNAGYNRPGDLLSHTLEDWDAIVQVNMRGSFLCSREAAKVMRDFIAAGVQPEGAIVTIGSASAGGGEGKGSPAYSAAKAGLTGFTRAIAWQLGPLGIRANVVAPGLTRTVWVERNLGPDRIADSEQHAPLRRISEPEDIAAAVAWLCSPDARQVTGQVLSVSGGAWMP